MVREIARATVEQARGSKQVTNAIGSIAETVQQIATATSEQARGSEQILRAAERMKAITKHVERSSRTCTRRSARTQTKGGDRDPASRSRSLREIVRQEPLVGSRTAAGSAQAHRGVYAQHRPRRRNATIKS